MGKWVILIGNDDLSIEQFESMRFEGNTSLTRNSASLSIQYSDGYANFIDDKDGLIISDYEPEEIKALPFNTPVMIMLVYSNYEILKRIVSSNDFPENCIIDCDGVQLGLEQFFPADRLINYVE